MRRNAKIRLVAIAALMIECGGSGHEPATPGDGACLADSVTALHLLSTVPTCPSGDLMCRAKCRLGDGGSCLGLAYSADAKQGAEDDRQLYQRACLLGAANGCTNYAAGIWAEHDVSDKQLACARRVFEKACAVKEQFACGMVGRFMIESGSAPDLVESRRYLEAKCDQVGGMSCRVLARHLESGKLGAWQAYSTPGLLKRACAGGDVYACGHHATAEETFH